MRDLREENETIPQGVLLLKGTFDWHAGLRDETGMRQSEKTASLIVPYVGADIIYITYPGLCLCL